MADLENNIQSKVDSLIDEAYEHFQNRDYDKSFNLYKEAFNLIPEPKEKFGESFNIKKYEIEDYLKLDQPSKAFELIPDIEKYYSLRYDAGELELIKGKIYFELGKYQDAHSLMSIAYIKSKGREFEGEDPKYKDFYLHPEKYIKD